VTAAIARLASTANHASPAWTVLPTSSNNNSNNLLCDAPMRLALGAFFC